MAWRSAEIGVAAAIVTIASTANRLRYFASK